MNAFVTSNNSVFSADVNDALCSQTLNQFMSLGKSAWTSTRNTVQKLLLEGSEQQGQIESCLVSQVFF